MKKFKVRKLLSLSAVVVLTAALVTFTALFAAGVFGNGNNPLVPSDGGLNGGTSSSQLNFGVFGATSTETGTVGQGYTASGTAITNGAGFRSAFTTGTGDVTTSYYLANDITLSEDQFGSRVVYKGTFDGNGKTITVNFSNDASNPTIWNSFQAINVYHADVVSAGMFGRRIDGTTSGIVKNVTIVINGYLKIDASEPSSENARGTTFGFIAGWVDGSVENVHLVINGNVIMENKSSKLTNDKTGDIAIGGMAGVAGRMSTNGTGSTIEAKGKFYNVKTTVNGGFGGSSSTKTRHIFAGGIVGVGTAVDINYAHLSGGANGRMILDGDRAWAMMGGIVGSIRPSSGNGYFVNVPSSGAVDINNIILTYEGDWYASSRIDDGGRENYQGAVIGVSLSTNTNGASSGGVTPFLLVTNYQNANNLSTTGSTSDNRDTGATRKTTSLYAIARGNNNVTKHVSVYNMQETVLGVAYNANGGSTFENRLKGISAVMQGWIATGISNLSGSVGSFVEDTTNPSMGGYFKFNDNATTNTNVTWKWVTTYQTEDIGSVPEPYAALGTEISTAEQFTAVFGGTGTVSGNYRLTDNITLPSSYTGSGATLIGTLDGMGHTVAVSSSAFSTGATYNSKKVTGGIVGVNNGNIYNLKVNLTGTVTVASSFTDCIAVGGVAGLNSGLIKNVEVTVAQGATAKFTAASGALAAGGIVGILDKNGGSTADLYNSRVNLEGTFNGNGANTFVSVGGAIGVMGGGNVNAVELDGQGVLSAGETTTVIPVLQVDATTFAQYQPGGSGIFQTFRDNSSYKPYIGNMLTADGDAFSFICITDGTDYLSVVNGVGYTWKFVGRNFSSTVSGHAIVVTETSASLDGRAFSFSFTPTTAYLGGIIGSVNPGSVNSNYPSTGTVSIDNLILNYYGEANIYCGTTKYLGAAVGYIKVSATTSVKTVSAYPKPLATSGNATNNLTVGTPSDNGFGGIVALGTVSGSASAVNSWINVQYINDRISLIYGGNKAFAGITARYDGPDEISGIKKPSHEDKISAVGNTNETIVVTVTPTDGADYTWEWVRIIHWTTVDTVEKFLRTFYQDANDDANDGVVNGFYQIHGDINLRATDFANLTPKIIGEKTIIDGLGTSKVILSQANHVITPAAVAAGTDYPNAISAAGIIGTVNRGEIKNVTVAVTGAVTASKDGAPLAVGGIVGINAGRVVNCTLEIAANAALYAGVSGTAKADIALGGIVGILHGEDAVVSASTAKVDGTLAVNSLADVLGAYLAVGGVIGVLGYGNPNTFNALKGGGKIGISNATNENKYYESVGGIVGSIKDSYGSSGFANVSGHATDTKVIDYSILDFGGKFLKADGNIERTTGNYDYFGMLIGYDYAEARLSEINNDLYSLTYSSRRYDGVRNMTFTNGEADATAANNYLVGFTNDYNKNYYRLLYLDSTVIDAEFGTDYDIVEEETTRVTVSYGGSDLVWGGIDTSADTKNCAYDGVKAHIYLFNKDESLSFANQTSTYIQSDPIKFGWNRPKPFEGDTATGETQTGTLMAVEVPDYSDGWATDFGRVMAGYGIPTDAYAISSKEKFREWLTLSETAAGYSYGYLTTDLEITDSLAGTNTTLQAGRTFDGAGRKVTFGATDWLRPASSIITTSLASYNGNTGNTVNSKVAIRGGIIAVNQGTIKNLSMYMGGNTITWTSAYSTTDGSDVGGLIGAMVGLNNGLMENCSIKINTGTSGSTNSNTDDNGFIVHKEVRANSARTILSVGGIVGANVNGTVRYSGAIINGVMKACNGDGGANNKYPTCFVGGVIGMQSGGTAEYLTVKGTGAIVNLSGASATGKFTTVGGIIGAASIGGSYTNSSTEGNGVTLAASTLGRMHSDYVGAIGNTGNANIGRIIGYLNNSNSTKLGGFSTYDTGALSTTNNGVGGWFYNSHGSDTTRKFSTAPLIGGISNSNYSFRSGGAVWVQRGGTTMSPATGFYNTYFDYWVKDTRLAIEFEHPAMISNISPTRVDNNFSTQARCILSENFYTGTDYTASVNATLYTPAADTLAFGNMRSTDTKTTSDTPTQNGSTPKVIGTSWTQFPLEGSGTYYLTGNTTIKMPTNYNSHDNKWYIGTVKTFNGTIDGNGYTLTIEIPSNFYVQVDVNTRGIGLLVDKMTGGTIKNLKLVVKATGEYRFVRWQQYDLSFGPLVGWMTDGEIDNVRVETSGNINSDSNINSYKIGLGGMIGRMTGGTAKNSLVVMNATMKGSAGTDKNGWELEYLFGGVVAHMTGGTLNNVALSGSGIFSYNMEARRQKTMGLYASVNDGMDYNNKRTITDPWLISCTISKGSGLLPDREGFTAGSSSNFTYPSAVYKTGDNSSGALNPSNTGLYTRTLHYYDSNSPLDFSAYTGNQDVTGLTVPTGGDNVGSVSNYLMYIDRALIFTNGYTSTVRTTVRNGQRGFSINASARQTGMDYITTTYNDPYDSSNVTKSELKDGWKIAQKGKLYLTDGDGNIRDANQTDSKEFDGSDVATTVKAGDPDKYAWTYTIFDWSGHFPLAWSAQGENGAIYDPVIRLSSAMPGTSQTITPSSRASNGYYFNDPAGRYVKTVDSTPRNLTYSINQTTLIVNPVASPGWDETRSANFLVPRGETGSIVQLVFYEDASCKTVAFEYGFDTYEYAPNVGINLVIEHQSAVGGSVYYVIAYFRDENSSSSYAAICAPTAIQVEVDNTDPVITLSDTEYIPDASGRFTAEKTVTVTDVSVIGYTIVTQPTVAVNVQNDEYGVYKLTFSDTAEVMFSVVDSVGREAFAEFLIDVEAPQMTLEFNTHTYIDDGEEIEFINSNGHRINIQTLSDNYVDEVFLSQHLFWRITDRAGTVLYTGEPSDFNLSDYVLSLNFKVNNPYEDAILEVWVEDSVGHKTGYKIGGGYGGVERLIIDPRTYTVNVVSSYIYKEGAPLPYTAAPQVRITDAATGNPRTANMGTTLSLHRFDTVSVANAYTAAGFTYIGFGVDLNDDRVDQSGQGVIDPEDEAIDTDLFGLNGSFVIDGKNHHALYTTNRYNVVLFYRLMLKVGFNGGTVRPIGGTDIDTSGLVGTITRSVNNQAAIATADYIEVTVREENGNPVVGAIPGNVEKNYTVSFDIRDEYANYYEIDTDSATYVLSIVDPNDPVIGFGVSAVNLTYATDTSDFIGQWDGSERDSLGWAITGEDGLVNSALKRLGTTVSKTTGSGNVQGYGGYTQFLSEYLTTNGVQFYDDFNYTVRQGSKIVDKNRILDAGTYSITVYIKSNKDFVGSFTLNVTVGKKTVYAYAFSQETVYGNGLVGSAYFIDWNGQRPADGGVLAADRTAVSFTYKKDGNNNVYYTVGEGLRAIKVIVGTFADGKINLSVGGQTSYSLNATLSGDTLTVQPNQLFAFNEDTYTALPQASTTRVNVGTANGAITLVGGSFNNYTLTVTNAPSLTITQRPITIVIASTTKGYNTADPATFNWAPSATAGLGFAPGDNAASFVANISREEGETVGQSYTISGIFTNSNYDITVVNGTLTVVPLQLQYILTGSTGAVCDDVTDYLGSVTAMIKNANAADSLTATVVYRVGFDSSNNPIFIDRDYNVLTMNPGGSFTLAQNAAVVRQNGNAYEFYGRTEENGALGWHSTAWTKEGSYVFRILVSSDADNAATVLGNYAYDNTEDRAFAISPRPITLVVFDQTIRYGDSINSTGGLNSTFKLQGVPNGVTISQDDLNTLAVNKDRAAVYVGQYTSALYVNNGASIITLRDTDGRSYAVSVVRGNLTIEKRELTVTWSNSITDTLVYNGSDQKSKVTASINASISVSNVVSGDNRYLSLSYRYFRSNGTSVSEFRNAGGYYVKATLGGDRAGNYYLSPTSETKYVNIDKAMTEMAFFGNTWNESKNALPYKVFVSGSKEGTTDDAIFNVSCTNKNTNIYVSNDEVLNGGSNHYNYNYKWIFTITTSSGTGWSENKYTGWDGLPASLAAGTYEMWVDAPETANCYGASGRCMFVVAGQTGSAPSTNGLADSSYNNFDYYDKARFYAQNANKTIVIKEGTTTINFSGGYGGFVGMNAAGTNLSAPYAVGNGVTLSNGGGSLGRVTNDNSYRSITWGYIYANIELSPELYMAQQNGRLTLSITASSRSDKTIRNAWNYNNADAAQLLVRAIKNSSYYGFGRSDANEGQYSLYWDKNNAIAKLQAFGNLAVNAQIHAASTSSTSGTVTQDFNGTNSSAYRIMLCAALHADDWDTGDNYAGMNVTFSGVTVTATVNDGSEPTVDEGSANINSSTGARSGTGLMTVTQKTLNGNTEIYNEAKYYQITVKDTNGVGVNPYTFKAVFGRQGKSDITYMSGQKTGTSANIVAGVKAIPQYSTRVGNTVDYCTVVFLTPFLSSDVISLKSVEVEDYKGNKLRKVFTDRTIDATPPVVDTTGMTINAGASGTYIPFDEGTWYATGRLIRFTVTDANFDASKVKLYYFDANGARRDISTRHTGNGVFETATTLTVNTLYYIEAVDRFANKTVRTFYFHIDPQSENSNPPLDFEVEIANGFVIESNFESAENRGRWNTGSIEITATVAEPEGGMGDGLGKFEYLALDYNDASDLEAYEHEGYKDGSFDSRWRALSLGWDEDGSYYFSTLTLSTQQQKLYVMRFVTEAGNVIYKPVGLVRIDSVVPQIFGTVADMNGKLAESGQWVGKGIIFNISGVNGLSKGTLQYRVGNGNWTHVGFDGATAVAEVTDSYFAATLTIKNQTVNGVPYSFRFLPGSGDEKKAVYLMFGADDFFNVMLDLTPPQIFTSTSDWQADQSTAIILTNDYGSGVADVIVYELNDEGAKEFYFTTLGAFNMDGTPISDSRRVVYDSGEYRFDFGAKSYIIRAVDAVGNSKEEPYKPQVDAVVPEFDISVISYDNSDNVGFNFVDVANLTGSTPDEVFGNAENFNTFGYEIANGKKVLFVLFGYDRYVGFWGGTGVNNYVLYDGTYNRTFNGLNDSVVAGLGFSSVELYPGEARIRATSSDAIYNVIDPSHLYENGEWTTDSVRFILTMIKVGKSGGTLYYSNNGMSDIASDWIPFYTVRVNAERPDDGVTVVNLAEFADGSGDLFIEAAGDRFSSYTFRFVSLSGRRVYYNFATRASEERDNTAVTNNEYGFAVNIDTTAPEIYGVEYRLEGTAFWSPISALSVADWFTAMVNIRFRVNDLFTTSASSGVDKVVLTNTRTGEETELSADGGYYTFVITETAGYIITATDGVGSVASFTIDERKVDTVPLRMVENVYTDFDDETLTGTAYTSGNWATSDVVFVITTENGLSGGKLTYNISGTTGLTDGLELISETEEGNKVIRVYLLRVSEDVEYTEYSFTLENEAGNAAYSPRTTYVRLDKTIPEIKMEVISGTLPIGETWSTTPVTLGIRVSDLTSGVVTGSFRVSVNGETIELERNASGQYVLPVSDMREYVFYVKDNAGNVNEKTISYNIDATPPVWGAVPVEAYTDYGTANRAAYDTVNGDWSVKPVTLVFNVRFNATADRAGNIEYSTDNGVTWKLLFKCGDEKYRVEGNDEKFVYTFKDGETLADVNGIFAFRAVSLSKIANEGENPTGYKLKVDQTGLSISATYSYVSGAAWTTPWANGTLKAAFDAVYGISGATLQVSTDNGANWSDVKYYEKGAVDNYPIAPTADIGNYVFRLVKGASASVTAETEEQLVRFDTAEPELSLAAVNTLSETKYSKGSWSGEGVTFKFTLVMGASYKDTNFMFSTDNGQTFTYMWRTENGALADGYTHDNLSDFAVSAPAGSGLDARYTVTFSYKVTEEIIQTRYMFAVGITPDDKVRGNGYSKLDRSFNDVNSVKIDRMKSVFLEVADGNKVTVLKSDGSAYDYSAARNWYNGNVTFTFAVRSYASGGSLRYSVDGGAWTSESVIRGAVTRGVDEKGRNYADTVYTLTLNSTVNAEYRFAAQSGATLTTVFDVTDDGGDEVSFFVSIDKNMPTLINNNLSYYRDLNGNGSFDAPYAPSSNSYVSDAGVLAVFAISDGDSGVDISGITVAKDGENVAVSPYDGDGRYSFMMTDSSTYTLTVRDNAGNTIVRSFRIGVDSVKPTLKVSVLNDNFSSDTWITDALQFRFVGTAFGSSGGIIEYSTDGVNFKTAGTAVDVFELPDEYFKGEVVFRAKSHAGLASDEQSFSVKVDRQEYNVNISQFVGSFAGNYADVLLYPQAPYKRGDTVYVSVFSIRPYTFVAYEADGSGRIDCEGEEMFELSFVGEGDISDKEVTLRFKEDITLRYSNLRQSVQFNGVTYEGVTSPVTAITAAGNNLTSYLSVTYSKDGKTYSLSELGVFYKGTELIKNLGEFDITVSIANTDYFLTNATGIKLNVGYFGETGSQNDPFVLNYEEDFAFLSEEMYTGNYRFVLGKDVTINDANVRVNTAFSGHLDGKNHVITLGAQLAEKGLSGGLFRELDGATVSNIGFRMFGTKVNLADGNTTFGTLADTAKGNTAISNVYVIADYTAVGNYEGNFSFGGIVGTADGTTSFNNVYSDASFDLTGLKADGISAGGVYGTAGEDVTVVNSYSVAVIRANDEEGVSAGMFGGDGREVGETNVSVPSNVYIGGKWVAETGEGATVVSYANLYNGTDYVLNSRYSGIAAPVRVGDIVKVRFNSDFLGAYSVIGDRVIFEVSEFNGFKAIDKYLWAEFTQTADFALGTDGQPAAGQIAKGAVLRGIYDGNGFSIELAANVEGSYALFDTVSGTLRNVTLTDVSVEVALDEGGYASVLVGTLRGGTVANTVVGGTLKVNAADSPDEVSVAVIAARAEDGAEITDVLVSALMTVDANLLELGAVVANLADGTVDNAIVISTVNATVDKRASLGAIAGIAGETSEIKNSYALSGNTYLDGSSYDVLVGYDRTAGARASYTDFDAVMTRNNYFLGDRDVSEVLKEQFESEFEGGGVGTVTNPFIIENAEDFKKISRYMFANYEIRPMIVGADGRKIAANYLDFGTGFETIGRGMMFTGSLRGTAIDDGKGGWVWVTLIGVTDSLFDMNYGTISILNITANVSKRLTANGTFGLIANENYGTIRQVDITGKISVSASTAIDLTVGAVVGKNVGGTLSEVIVSADVTVRGINVTAGLIAGEVTGDGTEAIVTNCLAEAVLKVTGNFVKAGVYVGSLESPSLMDVTNITEGDARLNLNVKG